MNRLSPKPSTIRALFAKSGNECSFPGCDQALVDDRHLFIAEVCHIHAVKPTEARFKPNMTTEQLRSYNNLILLCHAHHVRIDSLPDEFPASKLKDMKDAHQKSVEHKIYKVSKDTIDDALMQLLALDWQPYFEPTLNFLYDEIDQGHGGQHGMNRNSAQVCELLDATLYVLTIRALSQSILPERRRLLREYREWQEKRKSDAQIASLEMEGGSGAPFLFYGSYSAATKARITELKMKYSL